MGVGAGQGQSPGGHSAKAPKFSKMKKKTTAADCSSTCQFLLIFKSNGKSWIPTFVPGWKAPSVAVEGQHAAAFTWKFLQRRKIQSKDEKWAGCITDLASVTSSSKEKKTNPKPKLGISATGTEQTGENVLPDLKSGLVPETCKYYVTADYMDSFTFSSTFITNSFCIQIITPLHSGT